MAQKRPMKPLALLMPILLLAGCSEPEPAEQQAPDPSAERVECAVGGSSAFERVCTLERETGAEGLVLTIRAPSGSFRRLLVTTDGRGVVAADGAERATVTPLGETRIEVEVGGDRYRLPATVRP